MPFQSWTGLLVSANADSTAFNTSTAETSLLVTHAKFALPANFLTYPGQALRIRAMGRISNIVTTPGTLTLRVKFGATAVASTPAFALNTTAKTNVTWILDWDLTLRSVGGGTSATFIHSGQWQSESYVGSPASSAGGPGTGMIPATAPAVGSGFDSTIANVIDLTAQFSVSNVGNAMQSHSYKLESLN